MSLVISLFMGLGMVVQQRTPQEIAVDLHRLADEVNALQPPVVQPTDNLQAALDKGGTVHLLSGGTYSGTFVLHSGTTLVGHGATLKGSATGPALDISGNDITVSDLTLATAWDQSVVLIGRNDTTQNRLDLVPQRITLTRLSIPTYRGKRAFEINGANVSLIDCVVADTYDPSGRDSQAVAILNAPGPVLVQGGSYSAGSEVIMTGGDTMKIPGVVPTGITIRDTTLSRPLSWQTDGVNRVVKNLLELKTGRNVTVQRVVMDGSWRAAQDGYAILINPRSGGEIHDVLIEDVTVNHVGAGFNILGADSFTVTPSLTSGVVVRRTRVTATSAIFGGRGILALITGGPHDISFDNVTFVGDGNNILYVDKSSGAALQPDGTKKPAPNVASLSFTNGRATTGIYGVNMTGFMRGTNSQASVDSLTITGNTFTTDAGSIFQTNFPTNTYVDRATFDRLVASQ